MFLNFLGVPIADMSFDGSFGVYHSLYDNHNWVARIGDPGFRYHVTLVQFWGLVALRLAGANVVPLDYEPYARRIDEFAAEVERRCDRASDAAARLIFWPTCATPRATCVALPRDSTSGERRHFANPIRRSSRS